ncbi:MAG: T9SS type A sorting domain-containing protein [Crocinitomicaceae bacterium]|nr:T9SS type A sorting domain-containing protein [Crocinitomicaceae bacterium]
MKKLLLSLTLVGFGFWANSQVICAVTSPSSIAGNYNFTWADPAGGAWSSPDFLTPGTFVEDTLVIVNDGTPGNNTTTGYPKSIEGCNASPINSYTGKIAVLRRGTCQFGLKAYNAQQAGAIAVIVINNDNSVIAMGGGTDGPQVTIPVIMINNLDGANILSAIQNGSVVAFIGNKNGFYPNDFGMNNGEVTYSKLSAVNSVIAQNGTDYSFKVKGMVRNFGTNAQTNVVVNAKVTRNGATIYNQSSTPAALPIGDSLDFVLPDFAPATYPAGRYKLTYTTTGTNTDDYAADNTLSYEFFVSDSLLGYSKLDTVSFTPEAGNGSRPGGTTYTSYMQCINYKDANASRLMAEGIYFNFAVNASDSITLSGQEFTVSAYEWSDIFTDLNDVAFTNAGSFNSVFNNQLASNSYYYPNTTTTDTSVYAAFNTIFELEDNKRYLFCVSPSENKIFLGISNAYNYSANLNEYAEPINPINVVDATATNPWNVVGFGSDTQPSIIVRAEANTVGINENTTIEGAVYPNPTNGDVTLSINAEGKATISIVDLSGKTVASSSINIVNGKAPIAMNNLESGVYLFNVTLANGQATQFKVVKK